MKNQYYLYYSTEDQMKLNRCTLPSLSDLFAPLHREQVATKSAVFHVSNFVPSSSSSIPSHLPKVKRKRASPFQLSVLNHVFNQTYFPSTELRIELGKLLGMSPRTVQIWFQNKRQSIRTQERILQKQHQCNHRLPPPITPPFSPPPYLDMDCTPRPQTSLPPLRLPPPSFTSPQPSLIYPELNSIHINRH
ncbi:hypothetical protein EC973_004785 [Apophysomyces ossiformis]|uniref:Homeobox domain-containing protein n=1 Tax=Apophysomyces ossiformis TaxID=679940 RepID=A0A8H7BXG0_9FUNG|nr:hypothetical protein EC973_004785 [Apophysomyces ossiformis]